MVQYVQGPPPPRVTHLHRCPIPPFSVRPATPVSGLVPITVARPWGAHAVSRASRRAPAATTAVLAVASTTTLVRWDRSWVGRVQGLGVLGLGPSSGGEVRQFLGGRVRGSGGSGGRDV